MEAKKKLSVHLRLMEYLFDNRKLDVNYSIARVMLAQIRSIHDISIEEIAYRAHTSPGSVTKFCKRMGYKNFKEMKADQTQYQYANVFQDMIHISGTRGVDAAVNFFAEENKKKILEIMGGFDHEQIRRIAHQLRERKSGVVLSGMHGFASTNFFCEQCNYYGISICEISREAELSMIKTVIESEQMIFIISLSGIRMTEFIENIGFTPEMAGKIVLITCADAERYKGACSEVIALESVSELFSSNYLSSTTLTMLFLLITLYINEIGYI